MHPALLQMLSALDSWQALAIAVKTLAYGTSFIASGGALFLTLFLSQLNEQEKRWLQRIIVKAASAALAFSILRIAAMNGMLGGAWSDVFSIDMTRMILASREGPTIAARLAGLLLIGLLCGARLRGRRLSVILVPGAVAAAVSFGFAGHASELAKVTGSMPQLSICIHLFAVAFWLGSLWPLHRLTCNNDVAKVALIMQRFGKMAVWVVAVLVAVGALLLWQLLGTADALWQSAYGKLMLMKLSGAAFLLTLAAFNKLRLTPRLRRGDVSALPVLRRSIFMEMLVACLILLITATITTIAGPPSLG